MYIVGEKPYFKNIIGLLDQYTKQFFPKILQLQSVKELGNILTEKLLPETVFVTDMYQFLLNMQK